MTTTPNAATHEATLPFADDASAVLRAAVRVARGEAKSRGQMRGRVATGIGHLIDALAPNVSLEGLSAVTIEADPHLARVLARAEARARADGADAVTLAHVRDTLELRLRHAGTTIARLGYARYQVAKTAEKQGTALGALAGRVGDGEFVLTGLVPTAVERPDGA
jgi:hypothetical protein